MTSDEQKRRDLFRWVPPTEPSLGPDAPKPATGSRRSRSAGQPKPKAGDERACPRCGVLGTWQWLDEARVIGTWGDCECPGRYEQWRQRLDTEAQAQANAEYRATLGLNQIDHLTIATLQTNKLGGVWTSARKWLDVVKARPVGDYHDPVPVALCFYSVTKGTGKTHTAAALANVAMDNGISAAFVTEQTLFGRAWGSGDYQDREQWLATVGQARLLVIDDLGNRIPGKGAGVENEIYGLINRRYERRGWTIVTTNRTLDQLLDQRTINEAVYSRLGQMTKLMVMHFGDVDRRLEM